MRPLNVVIVNESLPYPPTAGNRIRTLNLMLKLAGRHRITYLCRGDGNRDETEQATRFLADHGIETIVVDDPAPRKAGPLFYARLAANLPSELPYAVASHNSQTVRETMRRYAERNRVDLWQFEWLAYADAVGEAGVPKVVVAHNVESLIWRRYWETATDPVKRWYMKEQWRRFDRFERSIFAKATRVVAVSNEDAAIIEEHFGVSRVSVVDNGVDREYFAAATGQRKPKQILFLGSLEWRPNLEAVGVLLDEVMPKVRAMDADARLCIVGRRPPESLVRRVAAMPHVELHGNVPDVRPFLAESAVMAVPLRVGGGSRLKILEAFASRLPVVSSRVGCEGLKVVAGRDLIVADEPGEMAAALVQCIRDPQGVSRIAENGRRLAREQYDWSILADRLEQVWRQCVAGKSAQRPSSLQPARV